MYKETMIMYIKENKYTLQDLNEMAQAIEDRRESMVLRMAEIAGKVLFEEDNKMRKQKRKQEEEYIFLWKMNFKKEMNRMSNLHNDQIMDRLFDLAWEEGIANWNLEDEALENYANQRADEMFYENSFTADLYKDVTGGY